MSTKYYLFTCQDELDAIERIVNKDGYYVVGDKKATFEEIKNNFKRNRKFVVRCFYNNITKKKEYQYSTIQIEKSYPSYRSIDFIEI